MRIEIQDGADPAADDIPLGYGYLWMHFRGTQLSLSDAPCRQEKVVIGLVDNRSDGRPGTWHWYARAKSTASGYPATPEDNEFNDVHRRFKSRNEAALALVNHFYCIKENTVTKKEAPTPEPRKFKRGDICIVNTKRVIVLEDQGEYSNYIKVLTEDGTKRSPWERDMRFVRPFEGEIPDGVRYRVDYSWAGLDGKGSGQTFLHLNPDQSLQQTLVAWLGRPGVMEHVTQLSVKPVSIFPEEALQ